MHSYTCTALYNQTVSNKTKNFTHKIQERRLKWYGHVTQREEQWSIACFKEGDGSRSTRKEEGLTEDGWIESGAI